MQAHGYRIVPVNPNESEILGEPAFPSLGEVPDDVDIVDVFRPANEAPAIAQAAIEMGARCLWLQTGIVSDEAREIAEAGGLTVVMDLCIGITHGDLGLGPGVAAWKKRQEDEGAAPNAEAAAPRK